MIDGQDGKYEHRFVNLPAVVTMRHVALKAGVATSTVSKALREDPSISVSCRQEIQRLAKAMGYRPNPLVAALMAQLHTHRRRNDPNHIAWIDLWPSEAEASQLPLIKPLLRGALSRAAELGYGIDVYKVVRDRISPERLRQILIARCQWGLVIPPVPETAMRYSLDLQGLTAVTIGTSLHEPVMHRVSPNLYQGGQLACLRLRENGFRRIGLVITPAIHMRVEGKWLGAYLSEQRQWPGSERLLPLIVTPQAEAEFAKWCERQRPDVLLIAESHVEEWLARRRQRGRAKLPTAWLLLEARDQNVQGIDYRGERIGAAAVEQVVAQIHRNERGRPQIANTLLMDGIWRGR